MGPTPAEITPTLAARWCGQVARRDDTRVARCLYRKPQVEGVYRRDEEAVWDDCGHVLPRLGVLVLLEQVHGAALPRAMVPDVPSVVRDGLTTWFGLTSMQALPPVWCSDAAVMPWVGFMPSRCARASAHAGATKMPLAVKGGPMPAPDTHGTRALVTQARAHRAGDARLHQVVCDRGFWERTDRGWLDQPGLCCCC